ncbi:putative transcription factor B3-Domain family [Helianthus anomalus]
MFLRMAGAENDVVVISDSEDSSAESEEFDDDETGPLILIVPYTQRFRIPVAVARMTGINETLKVKIANRQNVETKHDVRAEPNKNSIKYVVKGWAKWLKDNNIKEGDHCKFQYFPDIVVLFVTNVFASRNV